MYQSLQTPPPFISADPFINHTIKPPPSLTPSEGQASQTSQ